MRHRVVRGGDREVDDDVHVGSASSAVDGLGPDAELPGARLGGRHVDVGAGAHLDAA